MYEIQLDPNTIYDGNRDPDGFIIKIKEELFKTLQSIGYNIININGFNDMYLAEYKR